MAVLSARNPSLRTGKVDPGSQQVRIYLLAWDEYQIRNKPK